MQKHITTTTTRRGARIAATGLLAGLLALGSMIAPTAPTAHASALSGASGASGGSTVRYRRGYTVQHGWLCYGWPNGAYRCTAHWRWQDGRLVSLNTAWLPNGLTLASVHTTARKAVKRIVARAKAKSVTYSAKPRNTYAYGECTWGAMALAHDNVNGLGNARDWFANARARGMPTGYTPRVGATVTFQPGVQGASWQYGHVGHVVAVGAGGSFEMEAMNDSAGWGRFAFRWVHTGWGVGFIY